MKKNTLKIASLLLLFIFNCTYSQTERQKKIIQSESNKEVLVNLTDRLKREHSENYSKALKLADINGWEKRYWDSKGNFFELKEVTNEGYPLYYTTNNVGAAFTSRANKLMPNGGLGLNLTGKDLFVGVWDQDNANINHLDFQGRAFVYDNNTNPISYHSSHVTGTIISSGLNSNALSGRGIAYEAYAYISNWTNDIVEMATLANNNGLLLSNHSYGLAASDASFPEYIFGAYRSDSRDLDDVTFNAPYYQPVIAAGNDRNSVPAINQTKDGYDLLTDFATAKNAIVVAAVAELNSAGYSAPQDVVMSSFSSWGPTDDNRIKPDISMKGINVYSTTNATNNIGYGTLSGTSMASPGVTGTLLLLQQHFLNTTGNFMRSSTLRGLMIHTADEAGDFDGPDARFGWGLINAEKAALLITNAFKLSNNAIIQEFDSRTVSLPQGGTIVRTVKAKGGEPLIATISWTDRPGVVNNSTVDLRTPQLVNDLDIRISRGIEVFYPWRLNDAKEQPAIKADNFVDNVEKIEVKNPLSEVYTVTVSHKGSLVGGSQDFSLIISGIDETALGVNDSEIETLKLWPSPMRNSVNLSGKFNLDEDVSLEVFDVLGVRVFYKEFIPSDAVFAKAIDVDSFKPGLYIFKIKQGGKTTICKILKK